MRTTIDITTPVLEELKRLQRQEGGSLGGLVSRLLAEALKTYQTCEAPPELEWVSQPMRARVDLIDKDAVYTLLDEDSP